MNRKPPTNKRSNSHSQSNIKSQEQQLINIVNLLRENNNALKALSEKIDENIRQNKEAIERFKSLEANQDKKFNEIIQYFEQMNVSNGGRIENPLLNPIENIPNIQTNVSLNIMDLNKKSNNEE